MEVSELTGTCVTPQNGENYEDQPESSENEPWEEEINPLGLLDLVYVDDEEEANDVLLNDSQTTSSVFAKSNTVEEQKPTNDNSTDSDEGDELEPVAAVDVLPGREEDFLPEGMMQENMEPSGNTWRTCWVSNADPADHQWNLRESQLVGSESILQRILEVPHQTWPLQIQPLGSHSSHQLTWKLPQEFSVSQNDLLKPNQPQALPNENRGQYYQQYRQKYPELIRIRNREYARRYRQANAERVRERQRDYIRRYRERKRIEKKQAESLNIREEPEIITKPDTDELNSTMLLGKNKSEKKVIVENMPAAMKSKNSESEHILDTNDNNEIIILS